MKSANIASSGEVKTEGATPLSSAVQHAFHALAHKHQSVGFSCAGNFAVKSVIRQNDRLSLSGSPLVQRAHQSRRFAEIQIGSQLNDLIQVGIVGGDGKRFYQVERAEAAAFKQR